MDAALLTVRGVAKSFGRNPVLRNVDLDLRAGEVLALLGENGAGKSTLLNIVSGTLQPDHGSLALGGEPVTFRDTRAALAAGIVHIRQELSIIGALSVMENLFLGDYHANRFGLVDRRSMARQARLLLDRVGARHVAPTARAGSLRVAEQQMVEIAKALARDARVLLLDEPTASLTPHEAEALFGVVRQLRQQGVAVVFISHRLEEAFRLADRIVVLRDGRPVAAYPVRDATREGVIRDMTGRAFAALTGTEPRRADPAAPVLLEVSGLTDGHLLGPVSFTLRAGQILGIFGLVGAGRTELLECLSGARQAAAGQVACAGAASLPATPAEAWRRRVALLPEGRKANGIFPNRSVLENMAIVVRQTGPLMVAAGAERRAAEAQRGQLGIVAASLAMPMRLLSGGNQQKALFARCLATEPAILLLDEPTHGVDVRTKADIYRIIQELAGAGRGIIFVSSELPEILALATDIMVLAGGRVSHLGPNRDVTEDMILSHAFASTPDGPPRT